ncbi:MAG: hypothetical protein ABSC25_24780 [Roseiarcus sp.]
MNPRTQAGFSESLGGVFEWPRAVQHDRDIFQRAVDRGWIVEPEDATLEAGLTGDAIEFGDVPPGNDRYLAEMGRRACDMFADVSGSPVNHESGHHQNPFAHLILDGSL